MDFGVEGLVAFLARWSVVTEEAVRPSTIGIARRSLAVNFLLDDEGWNGLPTEWRQYFESKDGIDDELLRRCQCSPEAPLMLQEFIRDVYGFHRVFGTDVGMDDAAPRSVVDERLLKGMKEKKVQEVSSLAAAVDECARACGAGSILDVGSGHGHLARVLAFQYGHHVTGIDCSDYHAQQAQTKTDSLKFDKNQAGSAAFTQARITKDTTKDEILKLLQGCRNASVQGGDERVLLVGLHTCGDLATVMMKMLMDAGSLFCGLVSVPCCYSKNFCGSGDGFNYRPMSRRVAEAMQSAGLQLTEGSLMAACHSLLGPNHPGVSLLSVFRCLYQKLLRDKRHILPEQLVAVRVPTISKKNATSFVEYVARCDASFTAKEVQEYWCEFGEWATRRVTAFWTLRELVGVVVEVLILSDRCEFVRERGRAVSAFRCLRGTPRNVAMIIT
jgi:SAM-dependent methyltransferase